MNLKLAYLIPIFVVSACTWNKPSLKNKVIVDINGHQLTAEAFSRELAFRLRDQDALSVKNPKNLARVKASIVEDFIVQAINEEWARENNIIVKAEDLEKEIRLVQNSYPDDLSFRQALAEQGLTFREWKERLHQTVLQKLVSYQVSNDLTPPTEAEMQNYYKENTMKFAVREMAQIRQVVVATESDATAIEAELKRGKRMTDLAKKYSISPEGPKGGVVGWVEKGLTEIFELAFRMRPGQRSPIVKSSFGYHIFEVIGRKPAHTQPYNEAKNEIKRILMEKKKQSLYLSWLEERVRKARVFKDQAFIDAIKVETKIQ